jgi:uncharacterized membrane protein
MKTFLTLLATITVLLSGCGSKVGVQTTEQEGYIYFNGNTNGASVSIDGNASFNIKSGQNNQYSVKPGKHIIEISKNGQLILKREIYIGDGIAKEIKVQ